MRILLALILIGFLSWNISVFAGNMAQLAEEIEPQVVQLRGLPFLANVEKIFQSSDELRQVLYDEIERTYPGETLHTIEKRLLKFGFIAHPIDLHKSIMQLLSQQIAGYYDPIKKKMVLIEGVSSLTGQGSPLLGQIVSNLLMQQLGVSIDKVLLAHELTHVVQDQHFDLMSLPIEDLEQEDMALAARALIEGDATLTMMDYILQHRYQGLDATQVPGITDNMRFWTNSPFIRSFSLFQTAPRYLMDNLLFSYIDGFEFALQLKQHGGWEAINQAYREIPVSTEQILHPEKYFVERDDPTILQLPALSQKLADWDELEHNTLGEFNIRLLLDSYLPLAEARRASIGWDGDRFGLYEHSETEQLLLAWYTTWDTEEDAREFFHMYAVVLEKRYANSAKTATALASLSEEQHHRVWNTDKGNVLIELRGNDVLILDGIPEALQKETFQHLWERTQKM